MMASPPLRLVEDLAARNAVRLVLWDFDGVIADSEPLHRETYRHMLVERGYHPPDDFFNGLIGRNEGEIWDRLASTYGLTDDTDALRSQRMARFRGEAGGWLKPSWFVEPLLKIFRRRGICQTIVSSGNVEILLDLLKGWNINSYFSHVYGWSPAGSSSVDKARILRQLLHENQRSLLIEDDAAYLRLARSLGATTVGVHHRLNDLHPSDADVFLSAGEPVVA